MMKRSYAWMFVLLAAMSLTSCEVVGGIFKAGVWVGIIIVILVVALILWLIRRVL
ncbi:MAG TPA: phosphatidate cytidylyltransferase [Flavisolibacter sp.]|nr:phosphatidate cytidylyltransferase [Flavisolibacter sp.]